MLCFWWATNYFAENENRFNFRCLLAFYSFNHPIIIFSALRGFFTNEDIKEIAQQPKTPIQQEGTITSTKKSYRRIKYFYFVLLIGFLFLMFALNTGKNLISIVFDNSGSMESKHSIEALSETFDNLGKNNEIVLTTLEGLGEGSSRWQEYNK